MAIAAALLGGGLVLGMGIWGMTGQKPGVVPVIEADSRPLRVKPENPGGMQIAGANDTVLGGKASGQDRLAPSPEAPAPQALRAQLQPPPEPEAPAAAPVGVGGSPLPDTPPPPVSVKPPTRPAPPEAAAPAASNEPAAEPTRPAAPEAPRAAVAGNAMVQLAAVKSEDAARGEWERLSKRMPDLLGGRKPLFQRTETSGRVYWRIRTGGFASAADAAAFCAKVRTEKNNCAVASF